MTNLARLNAEYQQAKRDYAAGLICQVDLDKAEQLLDQALDNEPQENPMPDPQTYDLLGLATIDNHADEPKAIISVAEISGTDQMLLVFREIEGNVTLTAPVSILDLERVGGMLSAVAQDPTPLHSPAPLPTKED